MATPDDTVHSIDELFSDDIYESYDFEDLSEMEYAEYEGGADYE